jgi:deoxyribonuclease V
LKYHGRTVGAVLRTRNNVRPVFVSPGHRVNMKGAVDVVLKCTRSYRIPEPLRQVDILLKKIENHHEIT